MPATFTESNHFDTDRNQDARLAALIRQLAEIRPEILHPAAPTPQPASRPAPQSTARPPRPLRPHPTDPASPHHITYLRALSCGTHKPGQYWPAHATQEYYARKLRLWLRRRIAYAGHDAKPAITAALAFTAEDASLAYSTAARLVAEHTPRDAGTRRAHMAADYLADAAGATGASVRKDRFSAKTPKGVRAASGSTANAILLEVPGAPAVPPKAPDAPPVTFVTWLGVLSLLGTIGASAYGVVKS